jgi:hypothetical protein
MLAKTIRVPHTADPGLSLTNGAKWKIGSLGNVSASKKIGQSRFSDVGQANFPFKQDAVCVSCGRSDDGLVYYRCRSTHQSPWTTCS